MEGAGFSEACGVSFGDQRRWVQVGGRELRGLYDVSGRVADDEVGGWSEGVGGVGATFSL